MFRHLSTLISRQRYALGASLFGTLLGLCGMAQAEDAKTTDRWVSDNLNTYVRAGPTDGYRIVGTLKSGRKVELINTQGEYSQVRGEGGGTVWIPSADLQAVPGQAERLPQLVQQVADLTGQLKTIDDSWKARIQGMQETLDTRKKLIDELEARSKDLNAQLTDAQSELRSTQAKMGDENNQVLMRYMAYGGSIAGAGLLLGLIIPAMTRGRKRKDGWV
ncbi:TIGR04211 family SH3 domain-containing protein [Pseudomonas sp. CCI1.2]|uniref:TIGR04211 family SH3 domain-containing protein n=1 Tax=unclassified Pseudomonas TaxID=196821 RepID=UPI002AC9808D|nr:MULTISPECIES: TIGR04211 family SH3 domain-containing protein [unclassified Pseudomonas]MEB0094367.1 TIGR04211 family SH3 domain-containing protein [Pseudomonas sp. CCI4.2]MEB0119102.1 TIGR04211 family SH3 domain-containing protein [Pseudomonas sp. CCI1.2]WPX56360.1 TIGR04211 family SH3 domain-containing protein [Pseudomonas sp. CCI4.2]